MVTVKNNKHGGKYVNANNNKYCSTSNPILTLDTALDVHVYWSVQKRKGPV